MENLLDIYYLAQLIGREMFVYLRKLILRKLSWLTSSKDDFEAPKIQDTISKHVAADLLAFFTICGFFLLVMIVASKYDKEESSEYAMAEAIETMTVDPEENLFFASNSIPERFYGCGDSIPSARKIRRQNSNVNFAGTPVQNSSRRSSDDLVGRQSLQSQSTQTRTAVSRKPGQVWLVRRTRSGQVYGKYPV